MDRQPAVREANDQLRRTTTPARLPMIAARRRWGPLNTSGEQAPLAGTGDSEYRSRHTIFKVAPETVPSIFLEHPKKAMESRRAAQP